MPRFKISGLPTSVLYSMRATTQAEADERAAKLSDETHSPASLAELGVRIEEITFGDADDNEPVPSQAADPGRVLVEITMSDGRCAQWELKRTDRRISRARQVLGSPDSLNP
jgi:hypothetical protein